MHGLRTGCGAAALLLLVLLVTCAPPTTVADESRPRPAHEVADEWKKTYAGIDFMGALRRVQEAITEQADIIRKKDGLPSQRKASETVLLAADQLVRRLEISPLNAAELNDLLLLKNLQALASAVQRLRRDVADLATAVRAIPGAPASTPTPETRCADPRFAGDPSHDLVAEIRRLRLEPMQPEHLSHIGTGSGAASPTSARTV